MAAISIDGTPMTALPSDASQINYDNTSSGMAATQVQAAVDELKNGLINVNDWALLSTFNTEYTVGVDYLELLFCETNESGGTYWATLVVPARNMPSAMVVGTVTLSRSGNKFTIISNQNSRYIRLFKR